MERNLETFFMFRRTFLDLSSKLVEGGVGGEVERGREDSHYYLESRPITPNIVLCSEE